MFLPGPHRPSPPAPEGWDKDLTAIHHIHHLHQANPEGIEIILMLVFIIRSSVQWYCVGVDRVVMRVGLGISLGPRPRPRRVGIEDLGNTASHHTSSYSASSLTSIALFTTFMTLHHLFLLHDEVVITTRYLGLVGSCPCRPRPSPPAPEG